MEFNASRVRTFVVPFRLIHGSTALHAPQQLCKFVVNSADFPGKLANNIQQIKVLPIPNVWYAPHPTMLNANSLSRRGKS